MDAELQQLKDIHLPQAINSWPAAPGWIILFVALAGMTCYLIYAWYRRFQRNKTVKFAKGELIRLRELIHHNPENINTSAEISILIRRTALYYFHREEIAGLTGRDWLDFLNRSGNTTQFTDAAGRLLIDAPYRKDIDINLTPLFDLTQEWLMTISKKGKKA